MVAVVIIVMLNTVDQWNCDLDSIENPNCWTTEVEYVCDEWHETGEIINCEEITGIDCTGDYGCSAHTEVICENEELCIHKTRVETQTFRGGLE